MLQFYQHCSCRGGAEYSVPSLPGVECSACPCLLHKLASICSILYRHTGRRRSSEQAVNQHTKYRLSAFAGLLTSVCQQPLNLQGLQQVVLAARLVLQEHGAGRAHPAFASRGCAPTGMQVRRRSRGLLAVARLVALEPYASSFAPGYSC